MIDSVPCFVNIELGHWKIILCILCCSCIRSLFLTLNSLNERADAYLDLTPFFCAQAFCCNGTKRPQKCHMTESSAATLIAFAVIAGSTISFRLMHASPVMFQRNEA